GGAYAVSADPIPHPYAYYLLSSGSWDRVELDDPALQPATLSTSRPRAVVLSSRAFSDLALRLLHDNRPIPPAISVRPGFVVLLPGPLGACVDDAVRAGARSVGGPVEGGA
ncbi:MAG: hypothetical protein ABIT71_26445, partial [Vicinamibacteraceae bacterium]